MSSIDDLFKSALPSKRKKVDAARDPNEIYKSAKLSTNGSSSRHARVEDAAANGDDEDTEAGPSAPDPANGEDNDAYGPAAPPEEDDDGDDEEGRFFGGGITAQESLVLDFVDSAEAAVTSAAPDKIDGAWLRRTALAFERRINRNAELRARFDGEPARFIDSEAELDSGVRSLSLLADHPELYPEAVRLGTPASLVGLLAHENSDIAIAAASIVGELTDEDVAATEEQWSALVDALLDADLLGLLVSTLARLKEDGEGSDDDADREGVYHVLGVVENLCSRGETALLLGRDDALLDWLLQRAQRPETPVGQNKQYAAEILAILAQAGSANQTRLAERDAVDTMLQLVAPYRRRDPEKGGEEEEFVADLFEALASIADVAVGKEKFVAAEGVELCLIMLKEGKTSKLPALRLLDHAAGGEASAGGAEVCAKIVEAGGLKTLFTMFMKKADGQMTEHLVAIFASMLRLLPAESPERIRTLAKFMEKDYEKIGKLITLRRGIATRLQAVADAIKEEQKDMDAEERQENADEWFSRRLDAGLFVLQTMDVILAWLVAEDDGAKKTIGSLLADQQESLEAIAATLQEQLDGIDATTEEGKQTGDMLSTLIGFLQ